MSNILGPYDRATWLTMLMLKESIKWMKKKNSSKSAIDKETSMFRDFIRGAA